MAVDKIVKRTITINAPASRVWEVLTALEMVNEWIIGEGATNVTTDWKVGSPILYEVAWQKHKYLVKGIILSFEPENVLKYSQWSKFSNLPDVTENYTVIEFVLSPGEDSTTLTLTHSNFPLEEIYGHTNFYWATALNRIKKLAEAAQQS